MTSLTIKLPTDLKNRVEHEARLAGKSVSAVVRDALLARSAPAAAESSLFERTRDLCGAGDSGVADLATHTRHLADFGR
jgi:predicted transcriptional regulator